MAEYSVILWSPAIGAAAWLAVAAYLVLQRRFRTWTEVFFLGLCLSVAAYAICDLVFFNMAVDPTRRIAATASLSSLTFATFFVYLYGVSLYRRFRWLLLVALLPVAFFVATFYEQMFPHGPAGFISISGSGAPYVPVYNAVWLYPWIVLVVVLVALGLYGILKTYLEVRRQNPKLAQRIMVTLLGLVVAVVAGSLTNTFLAVSGQPAPPLFSTFLAVPGILIFFAVTPAASTRVNEVLLRRKAAQYDAKGAFLTYSDGTLIGSQLVPEEEMIDADSFSATLDVIQNFMRTSFPTLRGKWLKSIRHGDYTLVMERGKYLCLTLVLGGAENDQLRRHMQDLLIQYERDNAATLARWRGVATDAVGTDALLSALLQET